MSGPSTETTRQLPINLFTRDSPLAIPPSTYFLPAQWKRFQLSELINKVLGNTAENAKKPIPFDFLVEGEILRGSLDAWVKKHRGGDEETAVSVEYVRSLMPPTEVGRREVEDWVSGLSLSRPGTILLSSYLSHLQVLPLSTTQEPLWTLPLPTTLGATCATWVSPNNVESNILLAAGGVDRQTHVFQIPSLTPGTSEPSKELYTLHGHTGPISSVLASESGSEIITSSWDGQINIYAMPTEDITEHQTPAEPLSYLAQRDLKKRRKIGESETRGPIEGLTDGDIGVGGWRRMPDGIWRGHKGRVGALGWAGRDTGKIVYSGGWDGSVRGWDVETGANVVVRAGPSDKSILSLSTSQNGTIATGSMDRTISIYDPRPTSTSSIILTLPTQSPISALKCHPTSEFTMMGVTYSGLVQIWDIRSPKSALFSVQKTSKMGEGRDVTKNGKRLGERLLAGDWDGERVIAGGEDGEVGIWNARGCPHPHQVLLILALQSRAHLVSPNQTGGDGSRPSETEEGRDPDKGDKKSCLETYRDLVQMQADLFDKQASLLSARWNDPDPAEGLNWFKRWQDLKPVRQTLEILHSQYNETLTSEAQQSNGIMGDSAKLKHWQERTKVAMSAFKMTMAPIDSLPETSVYKIELRKFQEYDPNISYKAECDTSLLHDGQLINDELIYPEPGQSLPGERTEGGEQDAMARWGW